MMAVEGCGVASGGLFRMRDVTFSEDVTKALALVTEATGGPITLNSEAQTMWVDPFDTSSVPASGKDLSNSKLGPERQHVIAGPSPLGTS